MKLVNLIDFVPVILEVPAANTLEPSHALRSSHLLKYLRTGATYA
jgi:hypothetical protein